MTIKELKFALEQWPDDTEVEVLSTRGDRMVAHEIWDVGRDVLYKETDPIVVYIHAG